MDKYSRIVKALALGNTSEADELHDELGPGERGKYFELQTAFFIELLTRHLGDEVSQQKVKAYASEVLHDYRKTDPPMLLMHVEGLMRAVYGEDDFLDEMNGVEQNRIQIAVCHKIVMDSLEIRTGIDYFLGEAEKQVRVWEEETDEEHGAIG